MKKLVLAVVLTLALGLAAFGSTTDQLTLTSGTSSVTITDNGVGDANSANGTINYFNSNFDGWDISVATGTTHSPGLVPYGLDVASLTAACSGTCAELDIWYSDINFNVPVAANGFQTTFSTTQTGNGTASESAWFDNGNTLFDQSNSIGTVGPFSVSNVGTAYGGAVAATPNYSLTLEQVFTADPKGGAVSFSADGNITAVPEPAAVVLFGTVLALFATGLRRRRKV